mmetsp:Transcript_17197/g.44072  ORF Transcript_17197/g.44072 Transcript_17197/m.44072 type:complete len:451 (-) Transcript_17197:313-1665(-)
MHHSATLMLLLMAAARAAREAPAALRTLARSSQSHAARAEPAALPALRTLSARTPGAPHHPRRVLERAEWLALASSHGAQVAAALGLDESLTYDPADPLRNFVFEYYHFKPSQLRLWCPGPELALSGVLDSDFGEPVRGSTPKLPPRRFAALDPESGALVFAPDAAPERQRAAMRQALAVLKATASREPHFLCHGLHEWAMLYHPSSAEAAGLPPPPRHQRALPLRVSQSQLNLAVESVPLRCTHFDAFRFFTEPARPLNREGQLSRETQIDSEQPGCVHASMDMFKWTIKALPFIDSSLLPLTLRLALKARVLDMRASPYDIKAWRPTPKPGAEPKAPRSDSGAPLLESVASGYATGAGNDGGLGTSPAEYANGLPADNHPIIRTSLGRALPPLSPLFLAPIRIETAEGRDEYRSYQHALHAEAAPVRAALTAQYERFFEQLAELEAAE